MGQWLLEWAKKEVVLLVATLLAIISCFIVLPDAQYAEYVHWNTLAQLVSLMLVVAGLQRIGVFRIIASKLLQKASTSRMVILVLVCLTFFSGMLVTNDVALVTFVPFAISVLIMANRDEWAPLVVTLMTLGANLGAMLTPIGNAHNLYLKALLKMPTMEMIGIMAPYTIASGIMLVLVIWLAFDNKSMDEVTADTDLEKAVLAPSPHKTQPDEIRIMGYGAGYGGWRTWVYAALFVVCLLGVGDVIPLWLMMVIVCATMIFTDHRVFRNIDWGLPLTFAMFFIFIGNMKRVPEFYTLAEHFVQFDPLGISVLTSQFISNMPTTLLLSGFSHAWTELIIGTNLGGLGTLIASMASLVSYRSIVSKFPDKKGRYLAIYTGMNLAFLVVLMPLAYFILSL
ncbi:SLC13 family permease [Alloscardovia macacae]|uniref:Anion transporter n=1 Tax=Alloscardovia macacae TaxID=1160091 RepID=A0A1Y2SYK3_9BIFI|nr:SLC13 family permease [Alloscardovia macacae]OTA27379.1 anion transporter [Alloscardovia macacae]OTA29391.1 anion transporter [Alloscardovia macacae]OZG53747.1 citrate transporter [Alloscardovia macacae]